PQAAAADVAVRSGVVARQTGQRVIGVIENMSAMTLPDGTTLDLFGSGGGEAVARALSTDGDVPVLGSVPLSTSLRAGGDAGAPVVITDPDDAAALALEAIAARIAARPRGLAGRNLPVSPA
ncbi:MAG: sodium:proton antiporter, partial [Microbacterium sp.]